MINNFVLKNMKQISITIALALLTTIANAQNIKGSHQVRANDEVKKQQVENRSENRPLIYKEISQSNDNFKLPHSSQKALYVQNFKYNAHNFVVAYADDGYKKDVINNIYFYQDGKIDNPALLIGIVHHKSEDGKESYGAILSRNIYKNNKHTATIDSEIRLPEEISDFIFRVINNESDYKANLKYLKLYKSDSSALMTTKITRYE